MALGTRHYHWTLHLHSSPEELWPYLANTDRLNHDVGLSNVKVEDTGVDDQGLAFVKLSTRVFGQTLIWKEYPFEWEKPKTYRLRRDYSKGPLRKVEVELKMTRESEQTRLDYIMEVSPRGVLANLLIPIQIGWQAKRDFVRTFRAYDERIQKQVKQSPLVFQGSTELAQGAEERLANLARRLEREFPKEWVYILIDFIKSADDLSVSRIRPYALSDLWGLPRENFLDLFLIATESGLLNFSWEVLCPYCRGGKEKKEHLYELEQKVHCDTCQIDYEADFERNVELTFHPNASVRQVGVADYCMGSPERTPHVVYQKSIPSKGSLGWSSHLEEGRYQLRGGQKIRIEEGGSSSCELDLSESSGEISLSPNVKFTFLNKGDQQRYVIIERTKWSDQALIASDLLLKPRFRNLFSSELLESKTEVSVGSVTLVFTDLIGSTAFYESVGDASAFGCVHRHFEVLRKSIESRGGTFVKSIGDAVMAAFDRSLPAVEAMIEAKQNLAVLDPPFEIRVGIHAGPCIAVNLNDRLDYFGTSVNLAARLEGQSSAEDLVLSETVVSDPEVARFLSSREISVESSHTRVRGLDQEVPIYRIRPFGCQVLDTEVRVAQS